MKPYYQDDACTIYHGDCLEVMPLLSPQSVGVVLTDPPFSVPIKYEDNSNRYARSWGDLAVMEPFFRDTFQNLHRLCRLGAHVYICCDDESYPVFFKAGYPIWPQSHLLVWYKPTGRRGRGWMHSYELVLHFRFPETRYAEGFRQDVIGIMPVRTLNREHPAEKPGSLWTFLAEGVSQDQTGIVLDPFLGGGSSLRWCKDRGMKAVGIEIEERYCEIAARRLSQEVLAL